MDQQPEEFIPTRQTLLSRLKDWGDQDSWREFFNTYWKLIYGVAIRSGLTEQESQDVVQETMLAVAKTMPEFKYDPAKCSFKTWLQHLTRKRIADQFRKRDPALAARPRPTDDTSRTSQLERVPAPEGVSRDDVWEEEWQQNLVDAAIDIVKTKVNPRHYQMFYLCAVKQQPIEEVTRSLRVSAGQVYLAKHRISGLIKKEVKRMEKKMARGRGG